MPSRPPLIAYRPQGAAADSARLASRGEGEVAARRSR